jgi:hypothetical protein
MAKSRSAYNRFAAPLLKGGRHTMAQVAKLWKSHKSGAGHSLTHTRHDPGRDLHRKGAGMDGILGTMKAGAIASPFILVGKLGSRAVPLLLKMQATDTMGMLLTGAVQLGAGAALAFAAELINPLYGELVFAGVAVGIEETLLRKFSVPYLSTLAGDEGDALLGYTYEMDGETVGQITEGDLQRLAKAGNMMGLYPGVASRMGLYPQS